MTLPRHWIGIRAVFIAMGSTGIEGVLQRIAINAAAAIPSIEQVTRLSVLNTSAGSPGINQRAHYSIDQFASSTAVPYSTIRPRSSRRRCSPRRPIDYSRLVWEVAVPPGPCHVAHTLTGDDATTLTLNVAEQR